MADDTNPGSSPARRGRPAKGETASVYGRIGVERYDLLQRIREERGWSLVTAIERAIGALAAKEGFE